MVCTKFSWALSVSNLNLVHRRREIMPDFLHPRAAAYTSLSLSSSYHREDPIRTLSFPFHSIPGPVRQSRRAAPIVAGIAVPRAGRRVSRECDCVEAEAKSGEHIMHAYESKFIILHGVLQAASLSNCIGWFHSFTIHHIHLQIGYLIFPDDIAHFIQSL